MDYIKMVGAVFVVFAGAGFGACPVHKMKERVKEFEELYFCLLRLKSEIRHGVKTLPEAIKSAADGKEKKRAGSYRSVLYEVAKRMETGGMGYEVLLRNCVEEQFLGSVIEKEEQEAFLDVFLLLGGTDREKQIQMLEYYAENVRLLIAEEKQRKKERAYLYRSLGILGGVFLAVILY